MWKYNLIFFFCKFITNFFLVSEVLYERSRTEPHKTLLVSFSSFWHFSPKSYSSEKVTFAEFKLKSQSFEVNQSFGDCLECSQEYVLTSIYYWRVGIDLIRHTSSIPCFQKVRKCSINMSSFNAKWVLSVIRLAKLRESKEVPSEYDLVSS